MQALKLLALVAAVAAAPSAQAATSASGPLGSASSARVSANSVTFQDSTGENPPGPDITAVVARNNDAGAVSFEIRIPNRATLTGEQLIVIFVDADNNPATGDPDSFGTEYAIQFFTNQTDLFRWDGTNFSRRAGDPPQVSLVFSAASTSVTITINAAELGATKRFNFAVLAVSGIVIDPRTGEEDDTNARGDIAPDAGHGLWNYEVKTAPLRLLARQLRVGKAVAGRLFSARMVVARSDTGAILRGGQVRCVATVSGRTLPTRTRRFVGSQAVCTWLVPATARGRSIRGSITVTFEGLRIRRSFSAAVG